MSLDYYSLLSKSVLDPSRRVEGEWDWFVSAYNMSDRVRDVFSRARAGRKIWIVHQEYQLVKAQLPPGELVMFDGPDEAEDSARLLDELGISPGDGRRLCIDITGMVRPHMMCLIGRIAELGVRKLDVLYSEPVTYRSREETEFSRGPLFVRDVLGMEGLSNVRQGSDLMIIGAGYDDRQIAEVAQYICSARTVVVFGFPPLRPDMYQQNLLRASRAWDALEELPPEWRYFAPANDPFVTASVLKKIVDGSQDPTKLYLCPLSTKAQALGFVLYYLVERKDTCSSIIYPFSGEYDSGTTSGLTRTWRYVVEFPPRTSGRCEIG